MSEECAWCDHYSSEIEALKTKLARYEAALEHIAAILHVHDCCIKAKRRWVDLAIHWRDTASAALKNQGEK